MEKRKKIFISIICLLMLIVAGYMEFSSPTLTDGRHLARSPTGEAEEEITVILNAEEVLKDYSYEILVEDRKPTDEEIGNYILKAKEEVDETFFREGQSAARVTQSVYPKDKYVNGLVEAEWYFDNYTYLSVDGEVLEDELSEEGSMVTAEVELSCENYCEIYQFAFMVFPEEKTKQEQLLQEIDEQISQELKKSGTDELVLPEEVNGVALTWSNAKEHLILKTLLFEIAILIMIPMLKREQEKKKLIKREQQLLLEYPDMVSKLTILVASGMTVKQAWNRIAAQYIDKRQKNGIEKKLVYEEMVYTNRQIQDGESERIAYQKFGERTAVHTYHRFVRMLVQNLQKGTRGLCELLEQESERAFLERQMLAKKLGEEAGTKMLMPLIIMMAIVMIIVLAPAIIDFI